MTLIDRYIHAVTKHLPEEIQKEVGLELRSNILDMVPEEADENQIAKILENMGNPSDLAMNYHPKKKYLIGPTVYPKYIEILKLVLSIVAIVFTGLACLKWFTSGLDQTLSFNFVGLITDTIGMVVDGLLQAALWVTLIFVILERNTVFDGQSPFKESKWTIADLELPTDERAKISKSETLVGLCFNLVFATLASLNPNVLPLVFSANEKTTIIPLFDAERFKVYAPFIVALFLASAAFDIFKLIRERWTPKLALINALLNGLVVILALLMLTDDALISASSSDFLTTHFNGIWLKATPLITAAVIALLSIWDAISVFRKVKK